MPSSAVTSIEQALIAAAFRIANGSAPDGMTVPPELDCMTQAMHETCQRFGMSSEDTALFMLSLARRLQRLEPEVEHRQTLRSIERQIHAALQRPDSNGGAPC
ncbi:MAG: hypothetical protein ACKO7Z_03675 [Cyanobacteriota bacterium]